MRRVPFTGDEKESLYVALDRHRDAVVWKMTGLDDEAFRRRLTPTGTSLGGLVKHLAGCEYAWFCTAFGRETEPMPFDESDPEADLRVEPTETMADVLAFYARARTAADAVIRDLDVTALGRSHNGTELTLRWVLIHMIEETARHAGHLDILREQLDGFTGDHEGD